MNLNPKINNRVLIGTVIVACIGVAGYFGAKRASLAAKAATEAKLEEPEIGECKQRLSLFYVAWKRYRNDHKGADPPTIESMVPNYIKSVDLLICPTAARWEKNNRHLDQGKVQIDGKAYPETYGFRWLAAGFPRFVSKLGDKVPLIVCPSHMQAIYIAAYGKMPESNQIDSGSIGSQVPVVRDMRIYAVRRNGKVEGIDPSEVQ